EVESGLVDARRTGPARVRKPGTERDVRGGVLVQQRVAVRAARLPDPRRAVDECDLAEAAGVPVGIEECGEELLVVLVRSLELDEAAAAELAGDALDRPAAEVERPGAAERAAGSRRRWAREHLLGRHVRRGRTALRSLAASHPASP